jgi:hypothetical protein
MFAGLSQQGSGAIAIGVNAGKNQQFANSIVINATGVAVDANRAGTYIAPIQNDDSQIYALNYNISTKEITYAHTTVNWTGVSSAAGTKYAPVAQLGSTGNSGNYGIVRVSGTFGGYGGGSQSKIDFIWYTRTSSTVYGSTSGFLSATDVSAYCDFVVYLNSDSTFTLYLKTVATYSWWDFSVSGGTGQNSFMYPESSPASGTPSGTVSISSVFKNTNINAQDTPGQFSYEGILYASTRISAGTTAGYTSGDDAYLASFLDSTSGGVSTKYALFQIGRSNANYQSWFCGAFCTGTASTTLYSMAPFGVGLANSFRFYGNGDAYKGDNTNVWDVTSDEKVKENIELANLDICYDNIKNIPLKRFSYKDGFLESDSNTDKMRLGWIAQDVQKVFPKAVATENKGEFGNCLTLNADQLNAALFGAVKKLIEKVETLEAKVKELSG